MNAHRPADSLADLSAVAVKKFPRIPSSRSERINVFAVRRSGTTLAQYFSFLQFKMRNR
jgi:hypothetical protein